ncbi:hypothetical protein [Streptomyces sp. NPDC002209]|uniref:hypothetical protein n=1 Tax=Streptomyces sp. NPDC002209 TaxID=3364638 RepID=UPI003699330F
MAFFAQGCMSYKTYRGAMSGVKRQGNLGRSKKEIFWRVFIWVIGGVVVGLIPIWIEIGKEGDHPSKSAVLQKGDLFIASAILCAAAAADRIGRGLEKYDFLGFGAVSAAGAVFLGNTIYYIILSDLSVDFRVAMSGWLFLAAILSGVACVVTGVE